MVLQKIKETEPVCYVAVNKSRQKVYKDGNSNLVVFMNDKEEFQLEIFNPKPKNVMAKIYINGTLMSSQGLVIKPGQRIWLDRFIDNPNKLQFQTYDVENSVEALEAIANNGHTRVEFFEEQEPHWYTGPLYSSTITYPYRYYGDSTIGPGKIYFSSGTITGGINFSNTSSSTFNFNKSKLKSKSTSRGVEYSADSLDFSPGEITEISSKSSIETGRVERGSQSNQEFEQVNMSFNSWTCNVVEYKMVPYSQKQTFTQSDIRNYCPSCGKRVKQKDNFCSKCGNRL